MKRNLPTNAGFTLIETVIVTALSAIMLVALSILIYSFNTSYLYEQASSLSAKSARSVIREVESLTIPAYRVLQSYTFSGTAYSSSSTVLVLKIPSIDSFGSIIPNTYDYAVFYTSGTNAFRILEAGTGSSRVSGTLLLSETISALSFSYNAGDFTLVSAVTVDVQTSAQSHGHISNDRRREQLYLRNF